MLNLKLFILTINKSKLKKFMEFVHHELIKKESLNI